MKTIPLTKGYVALVDDEDFARVNAFRWYCIEPVDSPTRRYAVRRTSRRLGKRLVIYLHRFILDASPDNEVDHRDGDGLNCQKHNLREATRQQNSRNIKIGQRNTSGYKGVSPVARKCRRPWIAQITVNKTNKHLGSFFTAEDAARAYDAAARAMFGEFACVNFPEADERAATTKGEK